VTDVVPVMCPSIHVGQRLDSFCADCGHVVLAHDINRECGVCIARRLHEDNSGLS
jgi:hypothetical protein